MTGNKKTPGRVQPVEGHSSIPCDRKKITMSVATPQTTSNADAWPAPAPEWATCVELTPFDAELCLERCVVYASGDVDEWTAVVERMDTQEAGRCVEVGACGIRVETGADDIHDPQQARALARQLLLAADLLEQITGAEVADDVDEAQ
jgi:hypothetical protein